MPAIVIALIIAAALGGGTALLADHALPGDPLWGFKTDINENVEGVLAQGGDAKANWDLSVVTVRLDEAQALASHDKLDSAAQQNIMTSLRIHVQHISDRVTLLKAVGEDARASDLASRFQSVLVQHTTNLAQAPAAFTAYIHSLFDQASNQ